MHSLEIYWRVRSPARRCHESSAWVGVQRSHMVSSERKVAYLLYGPHQILRQCHSHHCTRVTTFASYTVSNSMKLVVIKMAMLADFAPPRTRDKHLTRNLAIANRSRLPSYNTTVDRTWHTDNETVNAKWPWKITQGHRQCHPSLDHLDFLS